MIRRFLFVMVFYKLLQERSKSNKPPLREFFEHSTVAIIGASKDPEKIGHQILKNIVEGPAPAKSFL